MTENGAPRIDRSYPVTPETRTAILECIDRGLGRNATARELGIPGAYVSEVAKSIGHSWLGTPASEHAREVRMAEIRENRAAVEALLWQEARQALEDMHAPTELVHFDSGAQATEHADGRTAGFVTHLLAEPTIGDRRNLSVVAGVMIQRASDLAKATAESAENVGGGIVDDLADGLSALGEILRSKGVNPTEPPAEQFDVEAAIAAVEADPDRASGDDL